MGREGETGMKRAWDRARKIPAVGFVTELVGLYFSKRVSRAAAELAYLIAPAIGAFPASL